MATEERTYALEDSLTTIQSLLQDVERTFMRVALKGCITEDSRRDAHYKLAMLTAVIDKLPSSRGDQNA